MNKKQHVYLKFASWRKPVRKIPNRFLLWFFSGSSYWLCCDQVIIGVIEVKFAPPSFSQFQCTEKVEGIHVVFERYSHELPEELLGLTFWDSFRARAGGRHCCFLFLCMRLNSIASWFIFGVAVVVFTRSYRLSLFLVRFFQKKDPCRFIFRFPSGDK